MEYKVICAYVDSRKWIGEAAEELAQEVNKELQAGWKLQGGVAIAFKPESSDPYVIQAMIKD